MTVLASTFDKLCSLDASTIALLGVSAGLYGFWKIFLPVFLTSGFLALWMTSFPTLRSHGFGRPVWNLVGGFVAIMALIQAAIGIAQLSGLLQLPCGASQLLPAAVAVIFCIIVYSVHLWRGNKGTLSSFLTFVVGPAMFETVAGSKAASLALFEGANGVVGLFS